MNLDMFNKRVGLMLAHIVEYSFVDITRTKHANTNYHSHILLLFFGWEDCILLQDYHKTCTVIRPRITMTMSA